LVDVGEVRRAADDVVSAFAADFSPALVGAEIHHIGATALPSGHTKGDVDVNVRVGEADFARCSVGAARGRPAAAAGAGPAAYWQAKDEFLRQLRPS
jgi:hypothetical protein